MSNGSNNRSPTNYNKHPHNGVHCSHDLIKSECISMTTHSTTFLFSSCLQLIRSANSKSSVGLGNVHFWQQPHNTCTSLLGATYCLTMAVHKPPGTNRTLHRGEDLLTDQMTGQGLCWHTYKENWPLSHGCHTPARSDLQHFELILHRLHKQKTQLSWMYISLWTGKSFYMGKKVCAGQDIQASHVSDTGIPAGSLNEWCCYKRCS